MSPPRQLPASFSPVRRLGIALNVALSLLALLAVVVMVNYLAARHYRRFLRFDDASAQLAPPTRDVLASLTNDVRVTVLFDRKEELFDPVAALLKEYTYVNPRIRVETVDYLRDPGRAEAVIARYQLPKEGANLVVFEANGHTKIVRASELSDYNIGALFAGEKEVKRIAFRGEPRFTEAIAALEEGRSPTICFLKGHREHDPADLSEVMGYSKFARALQQKNIIVTNLLLSLTNRVPESCDLLVVAGPETPLTRGELAAINAFLTQGGRLLVLSSFYRSKFRPTGLEQLLADWGVAVGNNVVSDPITVTGNDILVTNIAAHPIVKPLAESQFYLTLPRSVGPAPATAQTADTPRVAPLFASSSAATTASDISAEGVARFDPAQDRRGAISLAAAVEKGSLPGVAADRGSTRIVAIGDSIFLDNRNLGNVANLELGSHAVDWLLDRPSALSGIAPRAVQEYRITLTRAQMSQARLLLLLVLPGGVLVLGGLVWLRRRR